MNLDAFKDTYLLKDITQDFSVGRRTNLRFAVHCNTVNFTKLNDNGPEPFEYLEFAKSDIALGGTKGAINALGNAKRAIHLTIKNILHAWGLLKTFDSANFPDQLDILQRLNAFPTRMLDALNRKRNFVEHEFASVDPAEVADLVDITEMFLLIAYPFFKEAVVGAFVGIAADENCYQWRISPNQALIEVLKVDDAKRFDTDFGPIYYAFGELDKRPPNNTIQISRANESDWINYLDLFVYMTKRQVTLLDKQAYPGSNLNYKRIRMTLASQIDVG